MFIFYLFLDHRISRSNSKDVDHRNLISLTGSPSNDSLSSSTLQPPPTPPELWTGSDQVLIFTSILINRRSLAMSLNITKLKLG